MTIHGKKKHLQCESRNTHHFMFYITHTHTIRVVNNNPWATLCTLLTGPKCMMNEQEEVNRLKLFTKLKFETILGFLDVEHFSIEA